MARKKKVVDDTVRVECYRMSPKEVESLKRWLQKKEGIEKLQEPKRLSSPIGPELGDLFTVKLIEFFAVYAGTKILDYVGDQIVAWVNARGKQPFLITLDLNGERRTIGKGKPSKMITR